MSLLSRRRPSRIVISGHRSEYLVGVEHYQDVLKGRRVGDDLTVQLVADERNPYDTNAISGQIEGRVVGHLRRDVAAKYNRSITQASERGFEIYVRTTVQQRDDGLKRPGWLDLPPPAALETWLALPEDERARGFDYPAGQSPNTPRSQGRPI